MDGVKWSRENLIDVLVPTPFWATTDFDIPIELWRAKIGRANRKIILAAGAEILLRAHPSAKPIESDITSIRGFASACLHRGADSIYLFNYMDPAPMIGGKDAYRTLLQEGLNLATVAQKPRRHVVTYRDTVATGMSRDAVLPITGFKGSKAHIYSGAAPKNSEMRIVLGFSQSEGLALAKFDVRMNRKKCIPAADLADISLLQNITRAIQFQCPEGSLRRGYNKIQIKQMSGAPEQIITWLELRIAPQ